MTSSYEAQTLTVDQLLQRAREGRVRIPKFQRPIRWSSSDVAKLFDSIYRGYPIGTLLFWERSAPADQFHVGSLAVDAIEANSALWVVDGQQRVSALVGALALEADHDARFDVAFDVAEDRFVDGGRTDDRFFPVRGSAGMEGVLQWLRGRSIEKEAEERILRFASQLHRLQIPSYVVRAEDDKPLREIFDRINTFGKRMNRAEVFHALNTIDGGNPTDLRSMAAALGAAGMGGLDESTLMLCLLSTRRPDVLRDFRAEFNDDEDRRTAFEKGDAAIRRSLAFLREDCGVPHPSLITYQHLMVGLVRYFSQHSEPSDRQRTLLRRWYWRGSLHGPLARVGSTGTLRSVAKAATVVEGRFDDSIQAMLDLFPTDGPRPVSVDHYRMNFADTRIALCAMADLSPQDPNGERIAIADRIDEHGRDALVRYADATSGLDSYLFGWNDVASDNALSAILAGSGSIQRSHAFDSETIRSIRAGEIDRAVQLRNTALQTVTATFLARMFEHDRSDRPAIHAIIS